MRKVFLIFFEVILILPVLSGCWNQKEMPDLAFIMALGVDMGEDKKYDVSFQIVNPGNVAAGQSGGGQGLPIVIYTSSGDTLTEAARNATKKVSRRLYYAHTNLVVISEEVAKEGLLDILDALDRDPEFRTTTELLVARGSTARELVSTLTVLDKIPVSKITKQLKSTEAMLGENIKVNIDDLISGIVSTGIEPILNGYTVIGEQENSGKADILQSSRPSAIIAADGLAIFKDGKLVGWIENDKARGVIYIMDKVKSTNIDVNFKGKKNAISMSQIRSKSKVSVQFKNGRPIINIAIEDEGWISEANTAINLTDPTVIEKIDKLIEKEIKKQVTASIKDAQKLKTDIFGFGERVHRANPKLWKKIEGNWNEQFADLEVNVKVDSYIRREGVRTNPFWLDLNK
ncbi:Ger(x)C family spore germination protein [Neobacillus drentensis]|uniref:Ger(x)C family spore germination protein n=1 Tax=Neobacillus drentensis TaxID=220684 RepID=UPI002FFD7FA3